MLCTSIQSTVRARPHLMELTGLFRRYALSRANTNIMHHELCSQECHSASHGHRLLIPFVPVQSTTDETPFVLT